MLLERQCLSQDRGQNGDHASIQIIVACTVRPVTRLMAINESSALACCRGVPGSIDLDFLRHEIFEERVYLQHGVSIRPGATVLDGGAWPSELASAAQIV